MKRIFGKYRGKVKNNSDPLRLGRVQVSVPSILGRGISIWAMPCVPYAGAKVGFLAIPPRSANVWVEFEGGDVNHPIWTGCFWGDREVPTSLVSPDTKMFKTKSATITVDDTPGAGSIKIETTSGAKIGITAAGIEITNGKGSTIKLSGPTVSINGNALEVT
jgi:uncharacterized protein involved in type VI secretion and phage assembly